MKYVRPLVVMLFLLVIGCGTAPQTVPEPDADGLRPMAAPGLRRHPMPRPGNLPPPQTKPGRVDDPRIAQPAPLKPKRGSGLRPQDVCSPTLPGLPQGADTQVQLKLLLITATSDETGFDAMKTFLGRIGVPFDVLVASTETLCAEKLESATSLGNYQGIILTTNNLAYFDGTNWASAFAPEEWQMLADYERVYRARQVTLYTYPDGNNTGLTYTGYADTSSAPLSVSLTTAGQSVFNALNPSATIQIRSAWTYLAQAVDGAIPLITTAAGQVIAATHTSSDGRENLATTTAHNPYLMHSLLLNYGIIRWVTRGVFLGERRHYFAAHVDDYFIEDDVWDATTKTNRFTFKVRASDVISFKNWQINLRAAYPIFSTYTTDMAFNGDGFRMNSPTYCSLPTPAGVNALSAITKCYKSAFRWINHTFSHIYIDNATPASEIDFEINRNIRVATGPGGIGLLSAEFDPAALITGNHSGLGYLDEAIPPNNQGKSFSNPGLVSSAQARGVRWLASNTSAPTAPPVCTSTAVDCNQNNPSPNQGLRFPPNLPNNNILIGPRYPVNVFYNVTTPAEEVSEYNFLYFNFWGRNLTYQEILDFESDQVLSRILSYSLDSHYFHQTNLRFSGNPASCLVCDLVQRVAQKYANTMNVPIVNLSMGDLGRRFEARMAYDASGASAIWNKTTGLVSLSATNPTASIPLTNPVQGTSYGTDKIASLTGGSSLNVGSGL
jgi:hypothetical protein